MTEPYDKFVDDILLDFPLKLRCGLCHRLVANGLEPEAVTICPDCYGEMKRDATI